MKLNELEILEDDFDVFVALNDPNKIEFLFDAMQSGIEASILKQIAKLDEQYSRMPSKQIVSTEDYQVGQHRIAVTLTKHTVYLNSNSLKAIRQFVNKMVNDGLLLWPIKSKKTDFDMYRFYKAYKIIARVGPLSSN